MYSNTYLIEGFLYTYSNVLKKNFLAIVDQEIGA